MLRKPLSLCRFLLNHNSFPDIYINLQDNPSETKYYENMKNSISMLICSISTVFISFLVILNALRHLKFFLSFQFQHVFITIFLLNKIYTEKV